MSTDAHADRISDVSKKFGITPEDYMLPARHMINLLNPDGTLRPEDQQGTEPGHEYPLPSPARLLEAYSALVTGRRVNDQNSALVRQGRMAVYPSSHGQEACQVAASLCLGEGDWLFPTYRDTVAVLAKGVAPMEVMTSFRGEWHCGYDPKAYNCAPMSTPLTTQLLHAVGVAHAAKLRGEDTVVVAMCGDGATSEGDFHEALNFAAVFNLPVIFFVQNNKYAISVPLSQQSAAPSLAHKAVGYGMAGERVDGNDLMALMAIMTRAVRMAREGNGPLLIEAHTYRMQAHTNADDDKRYREDSEVQEWIAKDPVTRMKAYLDDAGLLSDETVAKITADAEAVAKTLRDGMNQEANTDPRELFEHVYSTKSPQLSEQQAMLVDELDREEA
ncbi:MULTISPECIES: pyruvate dehydrogenase (acetyl-transferring) E1 component subunit alpha [Glutamicibacter]|jgi:2-oxoisovalerate dehydrogenase E1 component alpha subunit|uniref:Pyruvate dehydrogenase (Acetyl-transferring) E1 component subunit alpha n=2 Tax=Glutamicibacter arilaitensis TaxID=256701 RepID=A0A2N7S2F1_9MICC|nr:MULTISPECIES: pyruvate dehydrogenase (acetyl-transferring) E1 component subunit alpha [Glutamicibacter]PMQ20263.1 pyruvate dehydrogenase (acetyl-transferring) E1 component subunit alpha [Glutamicibacter arilaitensis]TFH56501.1 pyruvate dehydrogenase (acetyl-transferring) E1 component subunit alpha [Glutamicibacter arilaitensis]CBT76647.1 2-oxoacid dehydrogenase E1 component alpha chain [Glutamicibacter arilaitensis Re117]HCH48157.1 pyruvate dehydrogenase (acetyl-transferring) E1 component su